jgi:hypothetical protein
MQSWPPSKFEVALFCFASLFHTLKIIFGLDK